MVIQKIREGLLGYREARVLAGALADRFGQREADLRQPD
jgi:hypothetical protein